MNRPHYTVEYMSSSYVPVVLTFTTLRAARGKARLLRRIGRDPTIYKRDATGATLVHWSEERPARERPQPKDWQETLADEYGDIDR